MDRMISEPVFNAEQTQARRQIDKGKALPNPFAEATPLGTGEFLIHVRFRPDGTVWEISSCPANSGKDAWFRKICERAGDRFEARAGGRGMFRLTAEQLAALGSPSP